MALTEAQINQKLNSAHLDNKNRLRNLNNEYKTKLEHSNQQKDAAISKREAAHNQSKKNIVNAYEERIRHNNEKMQLTMQRSNIEKNKALQEQKEFYEEQIMKQKQVLQKDLNRMQQDFATTTKINKIKLDNYIKRHKKEDERIAIKNNKEKEKISDHYKEQIKKLQKGHEKERFNSTIAKRRQNNIP